MRMRVLWVMVAAGAWMGQAMPAPVAAPAERPLVIGPGKGSVEGPRVEQLLGAEVVGEWRGMPFFVRETGMDGEMMAGLRWEVRKAGTQEVVADVDLQLGHLVRGAADGKAHGANHAADFSRSAELAALPDGEYVAAFVLQGKRVSNVVKFVRKAALRVTDEPLVRVVVAEPVRDGDLPLVGVEVARRTAADPVLGPMEIQRAALTVDGVVYPSHGGAYSGPGAPGVGGRMMLPDSLEFRGVTMDLGREHVVKAKVEGAESEEVKVAPGMPLGEAWDAGRKGAGRGEGAVR
jgi:hypothetical protein